MNQKNIIAVLKQEKANLHTIPTLNGKTLEHSFLPDIYIYIYILAKPVCSAARQNMYQYFIFEKKLHLIII